MSHDRITIRLSHAADERALRKLAALDSARLPNGRPLLIGESRNELRAALDLASGRVIADPFQLTAEVVSLLELRAEQLRREPSGGGHGAGERARRTPALALLRRPLILGRP